MATIHYKVNGTKIVTPCPHGYGFDHSKSEWGFVNAKKPVMAGCFICETECPKCGGVNKTARSVECNFD